MGKTIDGNKALPIIIYVLILAAAVFLFFHANNIRKMQKRCISTADAVVTDVKKETRHKKSGDKQVSYHVYITDYRFEAGNISINDRTTLQSNQRKNEGDIITVHYNPDDPEKEHYTQFQEKSSLSTALTAVSLGLGSAGSIIWFITTDFEPIQNIKKKRRR